MNLDDYVARVRALIAQHGWTVISVADDPPVSYTVGLTRAFGHPELIIIGLDDHRTMQRVLNDAVREICEKGRFEPFTECDRIFEGYKAYVLPVDLSVHGRLNVATALLGEGQFSALQIVWPDREGRYPFQPGCDPDVVGGQPILGPTQPLRH